MCVTWFSSYTPFSSHLFLYNLLLLCVYLSRWQSLYRTMEAPVPRDHRGAGSGWRAQNYVLVTHGLLMRIFCMCYFKWTVREFEQVGEKLHIYIYILHSSWYTTHTTQAAQNYVLVTHGLLVRILCMCYFRWTVREFEQVHFFNFLILHNTRLTPQNTIPHIIQLTPHELRRTTCWSRTGCSCASSACATLDGL